MVKSHLMMAFMYSFPFFSFRRIRSDFRNTDCISALCLQELNLEYGRYLKEVVQALESDPSFRKKLETAEVDDIKVSNLSFGL